MLRRLAAKPLSPEEAEIRARFSQLYWDRSILWFTRWQGAICIQNPMDVWAVQDIMWATRPEVLVETGTRTGASAQLWALLLAQVGGELVVTIDIDDSQLEVDRATSALPIHWLQGDSVSGAPEIATLVGGRRAMVLLDSDHTTEHVAAELEAYAPMVGAGCYLVCQDSCIGGNPIDAGGDIGSGPLPAIHAFVECHPEFAIDNIREPLFTLCTDGYLVKSPD
jgi:cephalosporin hydroxylase